MRTTGDVVPSFGVKATVKVSVEWREASEPSIVKRTVPNKHVGNFSRIFQEIIRGGWVERRNHLF